MNLRLIANAATQRVNPNTTIALLQSTGYTTDINGKRTATNQVVMLGSCNIQALTTGDLRHVEGLNIQGNHRSVYIYGKIAGL